MIATTFETARLLTWLFGIVMFVSALIHLWEHEKRVFEHSARELYAKMLVAAMIPLFAFTPPILGKIQAWLSHNEFSPVTATIAIHLTLVLQVWIWSHVAENPTRLRRQAAFAYFPVMLLVLAGRAGL